MTRVEKEMANQLAFWRENPDIAVRELWGITPDPWQDEVLREFGRNKRICMKASKGVGKTAVLAWLVWLFLLTRWNPKIACVAIDGNNLRDNLWTELAMWRNKSPLLTAKFEWTKTRIFHKEYESTWFCTARTWPKTADKQAQANTLAGLHADYIMFVLDESGGMPEAVMASADAALSSCIEGHIVQAGNPTNLSGPLYMACTRNKKLWHVVSINSDPANPMRSPRVSKEWAQDQIDQYGADNPWVLVNVFGQFPPSSINALIGPEEIEAAARKMYREDVIGSSARIMGVDVARYGDDASVICRRQGLQVFPMARYRNINSIQGAGITNRIWSEWDADACMLDTTGGYGSGWEDQLIQMGRSPLGINFSQRAHDPNKFFNKRAEMYWDAVMWIKRGGALPHSPDLVAGLSQTTYSFKNDKIILEDKAQLKERLGFSPDDADAFALTFAEPIMRKVPLRPISVKPDEYNPFAERMSDGGGVGYGGTYNPYA